MENQQYLIQTWIDKEVKQMFYDTSTRRDLLKRMLQCEETARQAQQLEDLIHLIELSSSTNRLRHTRNLIVLYTKIKQQLNYLKV